MSAPAFLVDMQLPRALARWLAPGEADAIHAHNAGLERAPDTLLCEHAQAEGRVIITKDADFLNLSLRYNPVVRLVWVRVGNMSTNRLIERFSEA